MFKDAESVGGMLVMFEIPAMAVLIGPVFGDTMGALYAASMLLFTMIAVGVMNIFLIVRHTRADEEAGRVEVIRSLPVGRLSNLSSAMLLSAVVNFALAVLTGFGLFFVSAAFSVDSMTFGGCMLYGVILGVSGFFFASTTASTCQTTQTSRGAIVLSTLSLVIMYAIRAGADIQNSDGVSPYGWLNFLSPLGLLIQSEVFVGNIWWRAIVLFFAALGTTAAAMFLNRLRDLGQGLFSARKGKREGGRLLKTPTGLLIKLQLVPLIFWAIILFIFGASYGSVMGLSAEWIASNEMLSQIFQSEEAFVTLVISMMGILSAIPVLTTVLKANSEEKNLRTEQILSKNVCRIRFLLSAFVISCVTAFAMLFFSGLGLWAAWAASVDTPLSFFKVLGALMVYLPALLFMAGLGVLLTGVLPEKAHYLFGFLGFSFALVYLGGIMLPENNWLRFFSPFGYMPDIMAGGVNTGATIGAIIGLTMLSAGMCAYGLYAYRKRDVR
jgi:ABC-2 type transport system permease protein